MILFKTTRKRGKRGALPREEPLLYPYQSGDWLADLSPVVVFAPHPDDETFGCGGLLLLMRRKGGEITLVAVTDGGKGAGAGNDPRGYVETRRSEFERVADRLNARVFWWGLGDREVADCSSQVAERARGLLEEVCPEAVFLPSPWEIHPDHRAVTEAVLGVVDPAIKVVFYEGVVALRPNTLVDISQVEGEKMELMTLYSSQVGVLPYHRAIEGLNRHRTLTVPNSRAAEAFVVLSPKEASKLLDAVRETERLLLPVCP